MSLSVEIKPAADEDVALQHEWYARRAGNDVAERFLKAFYFCAHMLAQQPDLGRLRHFKSASLQGVRSFAITRPFSVHLIFYLRTQHTIEVIRVLHGMRDLPRRLLEPPGA